MGTRLRRIRAILLGAVAATLSGLALAVPAFSSESATRVPAQASRPEAEKVLGPVVTAALASAHKRAQRTPRSFLIARPRWSSVAVRSRPNGKVVTHAGATTEFGSPRHLGVVRHSGRWLGVTTPALPNGRLGWVHERTVSLSRTTVTLTLDLSERRLVLREGRDVVRRIVVGVGRRSSPTPKGRFAVTDKLSGYRYSPSYGCCIVALSARQPHLPAGWTGGDRIAIHGTNDPASIGAATSAGCPHATAADMRTLMRRVPLGAPVFVHA